MKLVNRKTGEVVDLVEGYLKDESDKIVIRPVAVLEKEYQYDSLAQLNEDWKDYEETKEYYFIYYDGSISKFSGEAGDDIEDMKSIGNFFKTEEEAEEAVEKLKAYKRLKDKGLKDRNNTPIYEGDIVLDYYDGDDAFIVEWDKDTAGFKLTGTDHIASVSFDNFFPRKDLEVIGNIHENKELVGEKEKNEPHEEV